MLGAGPGATIAPREHVDDEPAGSRRGALIAAGTCLRIVLAPVVMALVMAGDEADLVAALLFVAVAATDFSTAGSRAAGG